MSALGNKSFLAPFRHFLDLDARAPVGIMSGDYPSYLTRHCLSPSLTLAALSSLGALCSIPILFSFAEYLAACCEDEGEENPP